MSKQCFARSMASFVQSAPQWVCAADGTGLRLRAGGLLPNVSFCLRLNAALCIAADAALEFDHAVERAAEHRKGNGQKCNTPFRPEHFLNTASFVTLFQRCLLDYALKGYGFAENFDFLQFLSGKMHGFVLRVLRVQGQGFRFFVIPNALERRFVPDEHGGDFAVVHHVLPADEHDIPVVNRAPIMLSPCARRQKSTSSASEV